MKKIGEPVTSNVANAWGSYQLQTRQAIEIEPDDIGKEHPNHLGHGRAGVIFNISM